MSPLLQYEYHTHPGNLIALELGKNDSSNANVSFLGSAYMHFGLLVFYTL